MDSPGASETSWSVGDAVRIPGGGEHHGPVSRSELEREWRSFGGRGPQTPQRCGLCRPGRPPIDVQVSSSSPDKAKAPATRAATDASSLGSTSPAGGSDPARTAAIQ